MSEPILLGLPPSQINATSQLESSGEQDKDFKHFHFFYAGIKKNLIELKEVLINSELSLELRVERAKKIVQEQLLGGSLFNQDANDIEEGQAFQEQDYLINKESSIIKDTIQNMNSQIELLTTQNKKLQEEKQQTINILAEQREKFSQQNSRLEQSLREQIQKRTQLMKNFEQLSVQSNKSKQIVQLSLYRLQAEFQQIKTLNITLTSSNSTLKQENRDLLMRNQAISQQLKQLSAKKQTKQVATEKINRENLNEMKINPLNSLEQQLVILENKRSSEDNSFANRLREFSQIQITQLRQDMEVKTHRIAELEQKLNQLMEKLAEKDRINRGVAQQYEMEMKQRQSRIQAMSLKFKERQTGLLNNLQSKDKQIINLKDTNKQLIEKNSLLFKEIKVYEDQPKEVKPLNNPLEPQIKDLLAQNNNLKISNEQLKKYKNQLDHYKKPSKQSFYKYVQEIFNKIPVNQREQFKFNLINCLL